MLMRSLVLILSPLCLIFFVLWQASLGGELFTVLRSRSSFPETTARFYAAGIVLAFEYMHAKGIVYRGECGRGFGVGEAWLLLAGTLSLVVFSFFILLTVARVHSALLFPSMQTSSQKIYY